LIGEKPEPLAPSDAEVIKARAVPSLPIGRPSCRDIANPLILNIFISNTPMNGRRF